MTFAEYYWFTFMITLFAALGVPTKLSPLRNFVGSVVIALFGFLVWPIVVLIAVMPHRKK